MDEHGRVWRQHANGHRLSARGRRCRGDSPMPSPIAVQIDQRMNGNPLYANFPRKFQNLGHGLRVRIGAHILRSTTSD